MPSPNKVLWSELLWQPLWRMKGRLIVSTLALVILSVSQGLLLLLIGPLLKTMLSAAVETVALGDLVPAQVLSYYPEFKTAAIPTKVLTLWIPALIILTALIRGMATYVYQVNQQSISLAMAANYRLRLFRAILSQSFEAITRKSSGEWMSVLINDVHFLQARFSELTTYLVRDGFTLLAAYLALFVVHLPSALLLLVLAPPLGWFMGRLSRRISRFAESWQREVGRISGLILAMRERFDFIRAQGGEPFESRAFARTNRAYYHNLLGSLTIRSGFAPWLEFAGIAIFVAAAYGTMDGRFFKGLGPTELLQFFTALGMMLKPLRQIGEQFSRIGESLGALRESLRIIVGLPILVPKTSTAAIPSDILIEHLSSGYLGEAKVSGQDLELKPGKRIAVIGPSGSGKSTVIKTLAGLLKPLDWQCAVPIEALAQASALVPQAPFLFNGDIRSNLNYPEAGHSDEALSKALFALNIGAEIFNHKEGLDRQIVGMGRGLSGGQIQRLVIARAILRAKKLWLLDEATSAIDEAAEIALTQKLLALAAEGGHILLAITHRYRCLALFDEVWYLEGGRVALKGSHQDLMHNARYRTFVTT